MPRFHNAHGDAVCCKCNSGTGELCRKCVCAVARKPCTNCVLMKTNKGNICMNQTPSNPDLAGSDHSGNQTLPILGSTQITPKNPIQHKESQSCPTVLGASAGSSHFVTSTPNRDYHDDKSRRALFSEKTEGGDESTKENKNPDLPVEKADDTTLYESFSSMSLNSQHSYLVHFFVKKAGEKLWYCDIVVIDAQSKQKVEENYKEWSSVIPEQPITILDKSLTIKLDKKFDSDEWKINPSTSNKITCDDITSHGKVAHRINFYWIGVGDPTDISNYTVELEGAKGSPAFTVHVLTKTDYQETQDHEQKAAAQVTQSQIFKPQVIVKIQDATC